MIDPTKRKNITERLGPLGNMVADFGSRIRFPVSSPPELAKQFSENEKIEVGMDSFQVADMCLHIPEDFFPINSLDDLVEKLAKNNFKNTTPSDLKTQSLASLPVIGYTVKSKKRKESLKREGGPEELSKLKYRHAEATREIQPVNPERNKVLEKLGPLGGMVLDLSEDLVYPINNKMELAKQFSDDEHILAGTAKYPIQQVVFRIPDNFFPITSFDELSKKLIKINFHEIQPESLGTVLENSDDVGLMLEMDEKRLKMKTENQDMKTGGPGDAPEPSKDPQVRTNLPGRENAGKKLGIIGDLVYDIAEQVKFPVSTPAALAANFKEKDSLLLGPRPYPLSRLALRVPQELFPLQSLDELVDKLAKLNLKNSDFHQLKKFIASDSEVRYKIDHTEEELKNITTGFEMHTGGPDKPPPPYKER